MDFEARFRDGPEEWNGLLVYPVKMRDYPLFLTAQESITTSQQSFPFPYSTMRYLEALYQQKDMFPQLCLMLALVFRFSLEKAALPVFPKTDGDKLLALQVVQGERRGDITPKNFGGLRELIARQNGLELPDETLNGEIVDAKRDFASQDGVRLKANLESLMYSVALRVHENPEQIMDWTVRRFRSTERAADRSVGHLISSVTVAAGGKFKGGSPYPSWKYDREEQTQAVEPLKAFTGRLSGSVEQK